ncbi:protein kinase domain-containing protein [Sorangium sp. So ce117]|uniref:protein kinase domain-containing protein n=1 Tax=Sorangium sp. So ce117 TaxID=3133277 RepID=UPI003F5EE28D
MSYDRAQQSIQELGYLIAEASKNVVFIVGAGLSMPAGLPSWNKLNEALKIEALACIKASKELPAAQKDRETQRLAEMQDAWLLGDKFRELIPQGRYNQLVRDKLHSDTVPESYKRIWALKPSGVVSFNLDSLAERALGGLKEQVASALDESRFQKFLLLSRPFLFQPHGVLRRPDSWVLGMKNRNALLTNAAYKRWIGSMLGSRRMVIVGFQPGDFSFQSLLLEDFRDQLSQGVEHYWLCSSPSEDQRAFAENYHLSIIEYDGSSNNHADVVEILDQLATFQPRKLNTSVVYQGDAISPQDLPPDEVLRTSMVEDIRRKLNAALKGSVSGKPDVDVDLIAKFMADYSGSVHMAWHIKPGGAYGTLFGYRLMAPELGQGAFGSVWKAQDVVDGSLYAIKVLHESVIDQPGFLESFHRGVRANRILSSANVSGMVKYVNAFDVPACVVMEYVDGPTFSDAMASKDIVSLNDSLRVVERVGSIVLAGHQLNKQVLHRDLKPANIMIRNVHDLGIERPDVVVLDFDLSWYEGAIGKSMMAGTRFHNYVAPEQLSTRKAGYSSRHTAVDVYGMGMLLYFATTGTDPELNIQNTISFQSNTAKSIAGRWRCPFVAVAEYLSMVIAEATLNAQEKRVSLPAFIQQVEMVAEAIESGVLPIPSDLATLEIVVRLREDDWRVDLALDRLDRVVLRKRGCTITCGFDDSRENSRFVVNVAYSHSGSQARSHVSKYLKSKSDSASSRLRKGGLFEVRAERADNTVSVTGEMTMMEWTPDMVKSIASALGDAGNLLAFSD